MGNPKVNRSKILDSDSRANPFSNPVEPIDLEKLEQARKIEELERKLNLLLSGQSVKEPELEKPSSQSEPLISDTYIPVMSLVFDTLSLSTREHGQGIVEFTFFGQTKQIVYSDLIRIMENHPTFLRDGKFYIMDSRVVRRHGLDETYSKILTKEMIDNILSSNKNAIELYQTAGEKQRETINEALIVKMIKEEHVDLNVIDAISRISGVNLQERAKISKEYRDMKE